MASRIGRWRSSRKDEIDRLQEEINELQDEIDDFENGRTDVTRLPESVGVMIARRRARIGKLEAKRDALQEEIGAL